MNKIALTSIVLRSKSLLQEEWKFGLGWRDDKKEKVNKIGSIVGGFPNVSDNFLHISSERSSLQKL